MKENKKNKHNLNKNEFDKNKCDKNIKKNQVIKNKFFSAIESYKKFYNENLKKKHIIIFVIMILIFFSMLSSFMNTPDSVKNEVFSNQIVVKPFLEKLIKEKIPLLAVIIFAGITPFFFLSVMGLMVSYTLAFETGYTYFTNTSIISAIIGSLGSIIQILAVSLSVATGIYYCIQSTKKFRYNQHMNFGLKDVKKAIYEIKKDEEKLNKLKEVEKKKAEKREKLNIKIPYTNLIISFVISAIILILGAVITNFA